MSFEQIKIEQEVVQLLEQEILYHSKNKLLPFTLHTMKNLADESLYEVNKHHKIIADYLDKFVTKKIKRLMIFAPPRHGKSELVSRRLPAFILGTDPDARIISVSYSADLAQMMNRDVQRIMSSKHYNELFPDSCLFSQDKKNATATKAGPYTRTSDFFEIVNHSGFYRNCGIGGGISGMGADYIIIDDPIKNSEEAYSKTVKEKMWNWFQSTLTTRLEKDACLLITLTRWFEDDLAGRVIKSIEKTKEDWTILNFPALKENSVYAVKEDIRAFDEPLWPTKYNKETLLKIKKTQAKWWSALYQGDPQMAGGNIIQNEWFKTYQNLPPGEDTIDITQVWDTAQKADEVKNAPWVCGTWVRTEKAYYLIHVYRAWHDYPSGLQAVKALYGEYKPNRVVIEDKSTGSTLIQVLQRETTIPCIGFLPKGDKETRLHVESDAIKMGLVYLPREAPWLDIFLDEIGSLPNYPTKDQGDMLSMALRYFREHSTITGLQALADFYEEQPSFGEQYNGLF